MVLVIDQGGPFGSANIEYISEEAGKNFLANIGLNVACEVQDSVCACISSRGEFSNQSIISR